MCWHYKDFSIGVYVGNWSITKTPWELSPDPIDETTAWTCSNWSIRARLTNGWCGGNRLVNRKIWSMGCNSGTSSSRALAVKYRVLCNPNPKILIIYTVCEHQSTIRSPSCFAILHMSFIMINNLAIVKEEVNICTAAKHKPQKGGPVNISTYP
jgi:hypothetical protein